MAVDQRRRRYSLTVILWVAIVVSTSGQGQTNDIIQRAEAEFNVGHGAEAINLWKQALAEYRASGDLKGQLETLGRLGRTANLIGQPASAVTYLTDALDVARRTGNAAMEASILIDLAEAASKSSNYPQAIVANRELLARAEAAHDPAVGSIAAARLGQALIESHQSQQAIFAFQRASELFHLLGNTINEAAALNYLGDAQRNVENYVAASEAYQKASKLAHEAGEATLEADAVHGLGVSFYYLGDYPGATKTLNKAIHIARLAGAQSTEAAALMTLGNVQYFQKQTKEALSSYERVLELAKANKDKKLEGEVLGNLGLTLTHLQQYERAMEYFRQDIAIAQERGDRLVESQALGNLAGLLLQQKRYDESIPLLERSRDQAREIQYRRGEGIALRNLGFAQLRSGLAAAAEISLRAAVAVQEDLRNQTSAIDKFNISLFDTQRDSFRLLQATLVAQNKTDAALEVSEFGRARALADLMAAGERISSPSIEAIRSVALSRRMTLVEFSIVPEDSAIYIWVVQADGSVHFRRTSFDVQGGSIDHAMEQLVRDGRSALGAIGPMDNRKTDVDADARKDFLGVLYRILIAPIEPLLPAAPDAQVVFIPQGPLFLLPFAALLDTAGKTLLESHTLAVAPSIQMLELLGSKRNTPNKTALVMGNPEMPSIKLNPADNTVTRFPPLPASEVEAVGVAALLGTQPLIGRSASKANVLSMAADASVIHLATHGVADDVRGQGVPGALILAAGNSDDGVLSTQDIMSLRLQANLVVLSACNTGLGKISGDGVIGLSRAFLAAGAQSVVVSLWSVPDQPTAALMQDFYQRLAETPHKAAALRHAMLTTRAKHADPLAWAGFILVGDSE